MRQQLGVGFQLSDGITTGVACQHKQATDNEADIVMVCEVGGPESLEHFAKHILKGEYVSYSLPSNSDRGIDLGYLVKRNLPFKFNLKSHKDRLLRSKIYHYFSRDVLELAIGDVTEK
jgi:hypothetical protein